MLWIYRESVQLDITAASQAGNFKKRKLKVPKSREEVLAQYNRGLIMVFTGNGKGKTTAALGQALRAIGHGNKVYLLQFMKGRKYGELIAAEKYLPDLTFYLAGLDSFVMRDSPAPIDIELAKQGLDIAREVIESNEYDMVILDEITVAIDFKLISLNEVIKIIKNKPAGLHLILTGRYAPPEILELADTVSEIKEIRHHYTAGIKEKTGIDY